MGPQVSDILGVFELFLGALEKTKEKTDKVFDPIRESNCAVNL